MHGSWKDWAQDLASLVVVAAIVIMTPLVCDALINAEPGHGLHASAEGR